MTKISAIILLGFGLAATPASAATFEGGALLNHLWTDADGTHADGFGVSLDGVRLYNAHEGISLRVSHAGLDAGGTDVDRQTVSAGYWRYLDGDGLELAGFRPYVNGALGFGRYKAGGLDDDGLLLEAAGGVVSKWDVLVPGLKFRTELRLGWDEAADAGVVVGIGAGLHYAFGAPSPAPRPSAPVPAAAPAKPAPSPTSDDADGDGVRNRDDACPNTPAGVAVDARGCVDVAKVVLKGVSFATASATLQPDAMPVLRGVAATLKANPGLSIEVHGHTDSEGEAARNMALSERRAQAVKSFLVKEGAPASRIAVKGFGERQPVDTNDTAEGRAKNRRVEFRVLGG